MKYFDDANSSRLISQKAVKDKNMRRIFSELALGRDVSRASISRRLQLTPSTVTSLVDDMISKRLISESNIVDMGVSGRKPMQLEINPAGMRIPVLSFRQNGILYTLLDCTLSAIENSFEPFPEEQGSSQQSGDYRVIQTYEIKEMVQRILSRSRITDYWERTPVLCITIPGTFDWEKGTFSSTVTNQRGTVDFIDEIRKMLRNIPILISGQTLMRGYAEYMLNEGSDPDTIFIETGTGIGSGIFINGKCFTGSTGLAGEIGHISVNPNGPRCLCGNRGCLEKYICRSAVIAQVEKIKGVRMNWDEICTAYHLDDRDIADVIKEYARNLLIGISGAVCILNVRRIIIGGDAVKLGERFMEEIEQQQKEIGYRKGLSKVGIGFAKLSDNSDIIGIARLYQNRYHCYVT